jgi:Cys-rich repeat protein
VECTVDDDCDGTTRPFCDRALHRCVECAVDEHCGDGFVCDTVVRRCIERCDDVDDCPTQSHGCDQRRRVCIVCDDDDECSRQAGGDVCGIGGSACVRCREDAQCDDGVCDTLTGECVECRDTLDCPAGGACDPETSRCVSP